MDRNETRSRSPQWIWIASIWFGFGLVDALRTVFVMRAEGMHHAWVKLFLTTVLLWLPWVLATKVVMAMGRGFPPVKLSAYATWLTHLAACLTIGLVFAAWTAWLDLLLNPYADAAAPGPFTHLWLDSFYNEVLSCLILYAAILAVSYVLDSRARLAYQQTETARLNDRSNGMRTLSVYNDGRGLPVYQDSRAGGVRESLRHRLDRSC